MSLLPKSKKRLRSSSDQKDNSPTQGLSVSKDVISSLAEYLNNVEVCSLASTSKSHQKDLEKSIHYRRTHPTYSMLNKTPLATPFEFRSRRYDGLMEKINVAILGLSQLNVEHFSKY